VRAFAMAQNRDFLANRATARADEARRNDKNYSDMLFQAANTQWFESKELQKCACARARASARRPSAQSRRTPPPPLPAASAPLEHFSPTARPLDRSTARPLTHSPARPLARSPARRAANPKEAERIADILQNDLKVASEQLVKARRERLRDLYAAELRQWQDELAQRGLALPSAGPGTD